jgi:hypothetical protein
MSQFDDDTERYDWNGFGRTRRRAGSFRGAGKSKFNTTCKHCGMAGLKWRNTDEGWRLFEDERIEHNRLKPHVCVRLEDEIEDLGGQA